MPDDQKPPEAPAPIVPLLADAADGAPVPSLAAVLQGYEPHLRTLRAKSQSAMRSVFAQALAALPSRPTSQDVARWLAGLHAQGMQGSSLNTMRAYLHAAYEWDRMRGKAVHNVIHFVPPFDEAKVYSRPLGDVRETFPRLLAVMPDERARALVTVYRYQGIRPAEGLGLEAKHVDFRRGALLVEQQRNQDRLTAQPLKVQEGARRMPLHPEVARALLPLVQAGPLCVRTGVGGGKRAVVPFLFPHRKDDLQELMTRIRAVLPDWPVGEAWHQFRHAYAMELEDAGLQLSRISALLGHQHEGTTSAYLRGLRGRDMSHEDLSGLYAYQNEGRPPVHTGASAERVLAAPAPAAPVVTKTAARRKGSRGAGAVTPASETPLPELLKGSGNSTGRASVSGEDAEVIRGPWGARKPGKTKG